MDGNEIIWPEVPNSDIERGEPNFVVRNKWFFYLGILLLFILMRAYAWSNIQVLEDHDSVNYLLLIKTFQNFNLNAIWNSSPDDTFFYPVFGTIFAIPAWSLEFSGRLCSFFFTLGVFFLLITIGEKISNVESVVIALLLFTFNPFYISLSLGVLTEPSYIAIIYLGFYLYLKKYKNPSNSNAIVLGSIFALSFLNRIEGILFLVFIPVFQFIHFLFFRNKEYDFKRYFSWVAIYVFTFSLLISPQIYRVSDIMGTFALNGRQVWSAMIKNPDGKSYEEKKHGLDYSPKQINLKYLQSHPDAYQQLKSSENIKEILSLFMQEVSNLQQSRLSYLLSSIVLMLFGLGLIYLLWKRLFFEFIIILLFIFASLIPPAMHDVDLRHIAIVAPIMIIVAGIGLVFLSNGIIRNIPNYKFARLLEGKLSFMMILMVILTSFSWINSTIKNPTINVEYSPKDYYEPIRIIKEDVKVNSLINPIVVSRKAYFTYMADLPRLDIAFTDYEGLVKYCYLNGITYLFLQYKNLPGYPFIEQFENEKTPSFKVLYHGTDSSGGKIELYKFLN